MRPGGVFVTGTDTGSGKTQVSCALLRTLRNQGIRARGWKPVETGWAAPLAGTDAFALWEASGREGALEDACGLFLPEPLAPWVAAERAGAPVNLLRLTALARQRAEEAEFLVVEGAGGLRVPLDERTSFVEWVKILGFPVLVVAGNRLGCLNHTLLTVEVALHAGLSVSGVILNEVMPPDPTDLARATNPSSLHRLLPREAPFLGTVAWHPADLPSPPLPEALQRRFLPGH